VQQAAFEAGYTQRTSSDRTAAKRVYVVPMAITPALEALDSVFYMEIVHGIFEALEMPLGGVEVDCRLGRPEWIEQGQLQGPLTRADGLIVLGRHEKSTLESLAQRLPLIAAVDYPEGDFGFDIVVHDDAQGGRKAARHLLDRGFTHVGLLNGPSYMDVWNERLWGAWRELAEAGAAPAPEDYRRTENHAISAMEQLMADWLDEQARPSAIITPCGMGATAVHQALKRKGLGWPEDLSLVCFDQYWPGLQDDVRPTHVATYPRQLGIHAMQRMVELLGTPKQGRMPKKIVVPTQLVPGESVHSFESTSMEMAS
jgi:LacI family transcriptional regulator